jgi:uncharacterized RDD family membrane protein YckC
MNTNSVCYAGLWSRFAALFVDLLVFCAFFFPITRLVKGVWLMTPTDHRWRSGLFISDPICIVFFIAIVLYYVLLEGCFGLTVGKWTLGLRVIAVGGGRPGLKKAILRNVLRAVDSLPAFNILGTLLILRSPERARLGDRLAWTRVVHVRETNIRRKEVTANDQNPSIPRRPDPDPRLKCTRGEHASATFADQDWLDKVAFDTLNILEPRLAH